MAAMNIDIPEAMAEALRQLKDQTDVPVAAIVRRAIARELERMAELDHGRQELPL